MAAIFLAQALLKKFSGKGLVADALTAQPEFLLAVAVGAGATVILATWLGFPISTTHGLTGALAGAGVTAGFSQVNLTALGNGFVLPLLLSPVIAVVAGGVLYSILCGLRRRFGINKESCVCVGTETEAGLLPQPGGAMAMEALPTLSVTVGETPACRQRYTGTFLGMSASRLVDALHFLSAGAVSFARGLNDTPKIAALLLVVSALEIKWGLVAIGAAMALGGWLNARKVADTMANKITGMNRGQGLAANLATALLVNTASYHGLPVSTTHVSVGTLLGIGITTRQARWKPIMGVLLSWVVTLPCAAVLAALVYRVVLAR